MATMQNPEMRRARMSVLARCDSGALRRLWDSLGLKAEHKPLRGPETGLVMLRGRVGGTGAPFNVGEATVTRATVKLSDGSVGHAMAFGRDGEKARLSAVIPTICTPVSSKAWCPMRTARCGSHASTCLTETLRRPRNIHIKSNGWSAFLSIRRNA